MDKDKVAVTLTMSIFQARVVDILEQYPKGILWKELKDILGINEDKKDALWISKTKRHLEMLYVCEPVSLPPNFFKMNYRPIHLR